MRLSYNETFLWLEEISCRNLVSLKFADKDFFVSLVALCEKNGSFDNERNLPYLEISVSSLCAKFRLSSHVVQSAISSLCKCGVLEKVVFPRCFRPTSCGEVVRNRPSRLYIIFPFWERW